MQTLPQFKVLERGEQPPDEGYHVLLVHRFSSDWRALVHDITSRVPPSAGKVCHLTGRNASGHTVRAFSQSAGASMAMDQRQEPARRRAMPPSPMLLLYEIARRLDTPKNGERQPGGAAILSNGFAVPMSI